MTPRTIIRAAWFRSLRRTLISSQTIEPTRIAGFNQFYSESSAADSWRRGIGVNHQLSDTVYLGAEWSSRRIALPVSEGTTGRVTDNPLHERFGHAYLYFVPDNRLAFSVEYQIEEALRDPPSGRNDAFLVRTAIQRVVR